MGEKGETSELRPTKPTSPFERWSLDFIGICPKTKRGNLWILVAIDNCTKWPLARAVKEATAEEVAKFIYEEIFLQFGCPREILTDRAANFSAKTVEAYLEKLRCKHVLTSAYHPRTNGTVERFNRLFGGIIKKLCNEKRDDWDDFINMALFACRIRSHAVTGYSPFYLVYGIEPRIPGNEIYPDVVRQWIIEEDSMYDLKERINTIESLEGNRNKSIEKVKACKEYFYNRHKKLFSKKFISYKPGDKVFLYNETRQKFMLNWYGPFTIVRVFPNHTVRLADSQGIIKQDLVHQNRIKHANLFSELESEKYFQSKNGGMLETKSDHNVPKVHTKVLPLV